MYLSSMFRCLGLRRVSQWTTLSVGVSRPARQCWHTGWLCLILLLWTVASAQAGYIGFPVARQPNWQPRLEVTGDSFKIDLEGDGNAEATTGRALATVSFGLTPWMELFARVGLAEFNIANADFKGDFGWAYGGGVRFRVWELPFFQVGLTGQYLRFTSDDGNSAGLKVDGEWEAFDIGVGVGTRRVSAFQFYGGVTYHQADITLTSTANRFNLEQETPVLAFVGVHIFPLVDFPRGEFLVNVEARFVGETPQFTLGVQYQFGVTRGRSDR